MECEVQGLNIYYEVVGEGRPIVMLHGGYADHSRMRREFEPLFDNHPGWMRIYPDLPGHGRTPARDWIGNHDQVLDILLEFIDTLIPSQSFALAGVSRSGYLARGVIYKRPAAVDGALLLVPTRYAVAPEASLPARLRLVTDDGLVRELKPSEAALFDELIVQSRTALERMREYVFPAFEMADADFQNRIMLNYEFSFDVDELPQPFEKPVLILAGTQDSWVGYRDAWKMMDHFPRATFAVIDKAGHMLGLEQEVLFRALADEWLTRVEEHAESR